VADGPDRLIVEHLPGEVLVYDTATNAAHVLGGSVAAAFDEAADEVSRRDLIRKMAVAGAAAAGGAPLVKSILAPTSADAQSTCSGPCFGSCVPFTCICVGFNLTLGTPGTCVSDRDLKRDLRPADPHWLLGFVAQVS
jgi:hypothetical protein